MAERVGDQGRLLGGVALGEAGGRRGGGVAAGVARPHAGVPGLGEAVLDQRLRRRTRRRCSSALPAPRPPPRGSVIALQARDQRLARERIELLDADDRDVVVSPAVVARFHQVVGDLARAQHERAASRRRPAALGRERMRLKWLSPVKSARARHRHLVPQQRLGRHDHQRLAEVAQHLAAQDVEIIGRRGAVGDLHIVVGAELQDSARAAPSCAPAPALRSRAAAAARGRWRAATWPRRRR